MYSATNCTSEFLEMNFDTKINNLLSKVLLRYESLSDKEINFMKQLFPNGCSDGKKCVVNFDNTTFYKVLLKYEEFIEENGKQKENSVVKEVIMFMYQNILYALNPKYVFDIIGDPWHIVSNRRKASYNNYYMPNFFYLAHKQNNTGICPVIQLFSLKIYDLKNFNKIYNGSKGIPYDWKLSNYTYTYEFEYDHLYLDIEDRDPDKDQYNICGEECEEYEEYEE